MELKFSQEGYEELYSIDDEEFFSNFDRIKEGFKEAKVAGISEKLEEELRCRFSALYDATLFDEIEKRYNLKLVALKELKPLEVKIVE